jgi:endonuclease-3
MKVLPKEMWSEIGMAISFLGRDICRPKDPQHAECPVSHVCRYCREKNPSLCGCS